MKNKIMLFTCPLILLIAMKYSLDIEGLSDGDPTKVILHDKMIIIFGVVYAIMAFIALYIV